MGMPLRDLGSGDGCCGGDLHIIYDARFSPLTGGEPTVRNKVQSLAHPERKCEQMITWSFPVCNAPNSLLGSLSPSGLHIVLYGPCISR